MATGIAICMGCSAPNKEGDVRGNAALVASDAHLQILQEGHSRWAGQENAHLHQLTLLSELHPEDRAVFVIGLLPSSSVDLTIPS